LSVNFLNLEPLVSVITPSFNQSKYLEETINSVLNQNYNNVEHIIIDGGSTDNSVEVIKKYASKLAYWISEKDKGQADAINKGLLKASGDFICWINSDDILYPDFISRRIKEFEQNPDIDMIYGDVDQGPAPGDTWIRKGVSTTYNLMRKTLEIPIPQQSAIWRRRVLEKTGVLDPKWHVLLDRDYFIRISKNHNILYVPGALAFFRIHQNSKSIKEAIKWTEELPVYYESLIEKWADYKNQRHLVMAKCYWYCSNICSDNSDLVKAKEFLIKVKKESPVTFLKLVFIQFMVKVKQHFRYSSVLSNKK
jgi:glycosyltransferase involved in cell wall biosynthesis